MLKNRIAKLEQQQPVQVETEIKVMPEGKHEYFKIVNGQKVSIDQGEYDQHIARQVEPVNIEVKLPAGFMEGVQHGL